MIQRETTKKIAGFVAQYGSGVIVTSPIKAVVRTHRIDLKVGVIVAGICIGGVVGDAAAKSAGETVDDIYDFIAKLKKTD
jgi:hypothetical protein